MARRLLRLTTIIAVTAQQTKTTTTFEQGARKEWRFGDNQYKRVRDAVKPTGGGMEDERWKLDDRSECYSGTDEYMLRSVFCDAECLSDDKNDPNCAGPWYCARTKVCEAFHGDLSGRDDVDPENRKCAIIRSCANHSQCYPTAAEQKAMGISTASSDLSNLDDTPFKYEIAGFTVETTCCVNKKAYKHDVDIPCNAAARRGVAGAALVALLGVAIV